MSAGLAIHPPVHLVIHPDEPIRTVDDAIKVVERHAPDPSAADAQQVLRQLSEARTSEEVESAGRLFRDWAKHIGLLLVPPEDRAVSSTVRNAGGSFEEGLGRSTRPGEQPQAALRDADAQSDKAMADAAEAVREPASSFEDALRASIETRPYTALVAAFCLGWLLSRAGRYS